MPKRLMIILALASLAIAACHSSSVPSSSPSPSISPSPNPSIKTATIEVTILGTPAPHIPVEISTPRSTSSPRPGTAFETKDTGKKGTVKFDHLKPDGVYCWVAILGPGSKSSFCAGWAIWQTGTIMLGT
jgi:hypothetical protein